MVCKMSHSPNTFLENGGCGGVVGVMGYNLKIPMKGLGEKRLVLSINFIVVVIIELLSAGVMVGRPYKNRFNSLNVKFVG